MKKNDVQALHRENVALWWAATVLLVLFTAAGILAVYERQQVSELRAVNDDLQDNATAMLERLNLQHRFLMSRPVVYRDRVVYKELP